MQNKTVLIFGQSVRFLAQSAAQAGYKSRVADCFGDCDTLSVVDRWLALPNSLSLSTASISNALEALSQKEPCYFIYGSGIESHYPLLETLPDHITLCGNSAQTVQHVKTPVLFFKMLAKLGILFPETVFSPPEHPENFIVKSASGFGGTHIRRFSNTPLPEDAYFQQQMDGLSGSVLFLANGKKACLLSINRQHLAPCTNMPYRLGCIETPWELSIHHQQELMTIIHKVSHETALVGLNSLDFILVNDKIYVLEVNPRPSASAQLLADSYNLLQLHIRACSGELPSIFTLPQKNYSLHYLFAPHDVIVPQNMIWPLACHDLPQAGTVIRQQQPVCSILLSSASQISHGEPAHQIKQQVMKKLHYP